MDENNVEDDVERNVDVTTRAFDGRQYRPRNIQLLDLKRRQKLMSLQPLQALIIPDIPDHELNGEDNKLDYLRTMQQKALAFCRSRNIKVKTRRLFDEDLGINRLWIRREPDPDQEP